MDRNGRGHVPSKRLVNFRVVLLAIITHFCSTVLGLQSEYEPCFLHVPDVVLDAGALSACALLYWGESDREKGCIWTYDHQSRNLVFIHFHSYLHRSPYDESLGAEPRTKVSVENVLAYCASRPLMEADLCNHSKTPSLIPTSHLIERFHINHLGTLSIEPRTTKQPSILRQLLTTSIRPRLVFNCFRSLLTWLLRLSACQLVFAPPLARRG